MKTAVYIISCFLVSSLFNHLLAADTNFRYLSSTSQIDTLRKLSEKYVFENPDTAIYFSTKAIAIENQQFGQTSPIFTKLLADAYYYKNDFNQAIDYYRQSADAEYQKSPIDIIEYATRLNDIGYCYYLLGYNEMAIKKYNEVLVLLKETSDQDETYNALNNIGTVYFVWGQYAKAINYYEQTLKFDLEQNNNENISITYNNIGKVYQAWKKHTSAIDYFNLSLKYAQKTQKVSNVTVKLSNIGMTYFDMQEYDSALIYVARALKLDKQEGNRFRVAIRESELARILSANGKMTKAIEYNLSALSFFTNAGILESQCIVYKDLGDLYFKIGDFSKSEENYFKSIKIGEEMRSAYQLIIASKGLSELYEAWGKLEKSLEYYKIYEKYNTEFFNAEKHKQLAEFEIKYQTREKEIENQLLKNENQIKQTRLIYLSIILLVMVLLLVALAYGIHLKTKSIKQQKELSAMDLKNKEKEKQHLEDKVFAEKHINRLQQEQYNAYLEHKNQLLTNSTLHLINKNEFLISLKNKLSDCSHNTELTKKEIITVINQNIDIDQNWKKFSYDFDQIHHGFFDKLKLQYPDLSQTFVQISAYLRINLTTKEIAQMQHVSISAVNKNRQRLRKKLGLEVETDLSEFLKKFG